MPSFVALAYHIGYAQRSHNQPYTIIAITLALLNQTKPYQTEPNQTKLISHKSIGHATGPDVVNSECKVGRKGHYKGNVRPKYIPSYTGHWSRYSPQPRALV